MSYLNKKEYRFSYLQENIELVILSVVCFFTPFLIGHPQLLVGTIVNASLVLAALNLRGSKLLPIILLPSLAVLSRGLIFGPFTVFLLYMIPFIWAGNFLLIAVFKKLSLEKKFNKWLTLPVAAVVKTLFLFTIAFILVKMNILPLPFLTAMGIFQFYTAMAGGVLGLSLHGIKKKLV